MKIKTQKPYATYTLIAMCTVVWIMINVLNFSTTTETAILFGAYYKPFIIAGEYWRFLSVGLVHISLWHLFMNMMALYNLGTFMEKIVGSVKYTVILLLSIIGGSAFYFITSRNTMAVGLSGGLYGLMAGYTLLIWYSGVWKDPTVRSNLLRTYMINLLINFMPGVAAAAHLGGYFTGLLVTGMLIQVKGKDVRPRYAAAFGLMCAAMIYMIPQNAFIDSDHVYVLSDVRVLRYEKALGLEEHAGKIAQELDKIYPDEYDIYRSVMED